MYRRCWRKQRYNNVMTSRTRKPKRKNIPRPAKARQPLTGAELLLAAEETEGEELRWNRPRKQRISLRVDCEVVDWFRSRGPGYQTRINRILRKVMTEGKKRSGAR
jgi:uncharacterized protein (DUF4415 family)